jgi:hypothetical protein
MQSDAVQCSYAELGAVRMLPVQTFLLVASVALAILFFTLLGSLKPRAEGERVALTNITTLELSAIPLPESDTDARRRGI